MIRIVLDTNVVLSALRSNRGASFKLLQLLGKGKFVVALSTTLVLEYESVLKRHQREIGMSIADIDEFLDILCSYSVFTTMHYLWRPQLRDPGDEMVLETAVNAGVSYIVTFNVSDFGESKTFFIQSIRPQEFLRIVGE